MMAEPTEDNETVEPYRCVNMGAAFLEGINLGFIMGMLDEKVITEDLGPYTFEGKKLDATKRHAAALNSEINVFEEMYKTRYRPERPNFFDVLEKEEAPLQL